MRFQVLWNKVSDKSDRHPIQPCAILLSLVPFIVGLLSVESQLMITGQHERVTAHDLNQLFDEMLNEKYMASFKLILKLSNA